MRFGEFGRIDLEVLANEVVDLLLERGYWVQLLLELCFPDFVFSLCFELSLLASEVDFLLLDLSSELLHLDFSGVFEGLCLTAVLDLGGHDECLFELGK